ncbi:hypothetical protein Bca52824_012407 [Brassica carinata]|uniref:Uncharacterized protein n=1 Tax=Brassica carinata TaxID=52824 RepID=A0A8X8B0C0_BRACI|nr:hypothetical protein Bca52824_012407 [Brassica carinata]
MYDSNFKRAYIIMILINVGKRHPRAVAEFATVAAMHPLDVLRTRFQVMSIHKPNLACQNKITASDTFSSNPAIQWAIRTIMKEEAPIALYKGIVPSLSLVSHGAIQFTAYEELRKVIVVSILKRRKPESADNLLLGRLCCDSSKVVAVLFTYPFQIKNTKNPRILELI